MAAYTLVVVTIGFLAPLLIAMAADLAVSPAQVGQLVVFTSIPWGLAAPLWGLVSDRFGRRPVLAVGLLGMGLATMAGALAADLWQLAALRVVAGAFGSGGPPTIMAGLVEYFPARRRGWTVGWLNTSWSLSALVGVPLAGAIGGLWGWRAAFVVVGATLVATVPAVWRAYPRGGPAGQGAGNPLRTYAYLFSRPRLATLLVSNVFERVTFIALMLYLPSLLIESYGLDAVTVAPALGLIAVGTLVGGLAGGFVADRVARVPVAIGTIVLAGVCGLATFLWPLHLWLSVGLSLGFGLFNAGGRPPFMALLLGVTERHRGALNGLFAMSNQAGWALGAGLGGLLLGWFGYAGLGGLTLCFSLISAALIVFDRPAAEGTG